jgi:predicted transcriptional regulator
MHRNCNALGVPMKSSTFPSVRVDPELRQAAEKVLRDGETLSGFVEQSIRQQVQHRNLQQEFIERGLRSGESARSSGEYYTAGQVLAELDEVLTTVRDKHGK